MLIVHRRLIRGERRVFVCHIRRISLYCFEMQRECWSSRKHSVKPFSESLCQHLSRFYNILQTTTRCTQVMRFDIEQLIRFLQILIRVHEDQSALNRSDRRRVYVEVLYLPSSLQTHSNLEFSKPLWSWHWMEQLDLGVHQILVPIENSRMSLRLLHFKLIGVLDWEQLVR